MSKRAWYNCNERKARALFEQGYQVRIDSGRWQFKRTIKRTRKAGGEQ